MEISTFLLLISCLLFAWFCFHVNVQIQTDRILKLLTFILGLVSLLMAGFLLARVFLAYLGV